MPVERAVRAALVSNLLIAIAKFAAAFLSGSSAMLAEAYHSVSDTLNQVFLRRGLVASQQKADERHQFGYGKARYFWSFVVAMLLFGVAGAFSAWEGVHKILNPRAIDAHEARWAYAVLAIASLLEGYALAVSLRELRKRKELLQAKSMVDALRRSKDATLVTVVMEDVLAQVGLGIAALGLFLSLRTGNSVYDGLSSVAIGLVLMGFALLLARRNKELIIGEALDPQIQLQIIRSLEEHPAVHRVVGLRTMHMSPGDVLLATEINFIDSLTSADIVRAIDEIEDSIRTIEPRVKGLYIEPQDDQGHVHPTAPRKDPPVPAATAPQGLKGDAPVPDDDARRGAA